MAIISCWSSGNSETGKTASIAAITTLLAINHNYKILVLNTKQNDYSYQDFYWKEDKTINMINSNSGKTNLASGISGLSKAILSNKTSPEIVPIYTKIVFANNRLEILSDTDTLDGDYEAQKKVFTEIAKMANKYYDLVFIDIDNQLDYNTKNSLLEISDIILAIIPQKMRNINKYLEEKVENILFKQKTIIPVIGKYDQDSKYTTKNIARYLKEKRGVCTIPYNTLFFEACNEGNVANYFIKYRSINPKDKNAIFITKVQEATEQIIERLKELQMRM